MRCEPALYDNRFDHSISPIKRFCATPISIRLFCGTPPESGVAMMAPRSFEPKLPNEPRHRLVEILERQSGDCLVDALRDKAEVALSGNAPWRLEEAGTLLVLADLANLGWKFRVVRGTIYMVARSVAELAPREAKDLLRRSLLEVRRQQISDPVTQGFLKGMHQVRTFKGRKASIENLIDDGKELAEAIRKSRGEDLSDVVDPYIEFVDSKKRCEHTGLRFMDVWRYFRHTWSLEYRSTPGRSLCFLIRNRARKDHPIMGIVGLANAVFQLKPRDHELGWTPESVVDQVDKDRNYWSAFRTEAMACLRAAKKGIRSDDLLKEIGDGLLIVEKVKRLKAIANEQYEVRQEKLSEIYRNKEKGHGKGYSKTKDGKTDWKGASETPLFKGKRAETLASILYAEQFLKRIPADGNEFLGLLKYRRAKDSSNKKVREEIFIERWFNADFERAFKIALREIKKNGVATRILDVNVCGATPVYREILGGKLAAYALFAEEIQQEYLRRYGTAESEIASSMAGRPIVKPTRICALTTTSLYGVGSSQYNRVRMPFGNGRLEWEKIGKTEGYGTIHMASKTIRVLRELAIARKERRTVNNQFGEGTSPLMRQLREGLWELGFDSDEVLQHSNQRIVYLLELYPGGKEDLALNRDRRTNNPPMDAIAQEWTRRWLSMRVKDDAVLEKLSRYSAETVKSDLGMGASSADPQQNTRPIGDP